MRIAYEATAPRMPGVSLEQFVDALTGSDVYPVKVGGDCVGAVIVKECELHACVLPSARGRWFGRREMAILDGVLRKYGVAATTATTPDGIRFVQRLGFRRFGVKWLKGLSDGH